MQVTQIRSVDGTGTLSYVVIDPKSRQTIIIDPNIEDTALLLAKLKEHDATLVYIVDTHTHADHISGAEELRKATHARIIMHEATKRKSRIVDEGDKFGIGDILRANVKIPVNRYVDEGDVIDFGTAEFNVLHTPGHTDNHLSLYGGGMIFTGDLLLIGQAGRSDLPGGNTGDQYDSLFKKIRTLPHETVIYPGHDYEENVSSTLAEELRTNPFLTERSKEEYIEFVKNFFPPLAESMDGGKVILQCGAARVAIAPEGYEDITAEALNNRLVRGERPFLLDVREPHELVKSGALKNVVNIPVSKVSAQLAALPAKDEEVIVVCQSSGRSSEVARFLGTQGYTHVKSLSGGTGGWILKGYPVEQPTMQA